MNSDSLPLEKYIELENDPYYLARITVNQYKSTFHVELDIIHKETHKIYKHLGRFYDFSDMDDALETGYQRLKDLIGKKN